jgi:polyhydroxyalkanoate synthesis repressor PhaR
MKLIVAIKHNDVISHPRKQVTMKVIKRYANRKYYSKYDSKYIKIEDIANMVKNGDQVSILDTETNNDITHKALTSVLVSQIRKNTSSIESLTRIIKDGYIT